MSTKGDQLSLEGIDLLANFLGEELEGVDAPPPPRGKPVAVDDEGWQPDLNPTQRLIFDDPADHVLGHGEKGCRTADALIYTLDGVKRLGSFAPIDSKPGEFSPISQGVISFDRGLVAAMSDGFWTEPGDEALMAMLANGSEITGSYRHPMWVCWKNGKESGFGYRSLLEMRQGIQAGWRYWTPMIGHPQWGGTPKRVCGYEITKNLAYTIGALVGDGSLNIFTGDGRSVGFTNNDKECIDGVIKGLEEIGCRLSKTAKPVQFGVLGKSIKKVIGELGIGHLSYHKRIPNQIMESSRDVVCSFLSGLFDADGTVEKMGLVLLCTVSENLSRDVQDVLACLGILCVRRPKKSASGNPTWTLSMMGRHAQRFGQLIGFKITRKQARISCPKVSLLRPDGFCHNRYSYPDPIRDEMRAVAVESRTGKRNYGRPIKFKKEIRKCGERWVLNRYVQWQEKPITMTCKTAEEAATHEAILESMRLDYVRLHCSSRKWHDDYRHLHSFGSIPSREKLGKFCALYGCCERFLNYLVSDVWLEVVGVEPRKAKLFDLHVPGTHSFLASGTINHNSGKSIGFAHKCVRHAYEVDNALILIVTPMIRTGNEGIWMDLQTLVLPAWRDGIGLEYTESKLDPLTKDRHRWIRNRHGGWSKMLLLSIPHASQVQARVKGPAPSMIYIDELTEYEARQIWQFPAAQLGRRRIEPADYPQQFCASCNAKGPSHWVYKVWFEECVDKETGKRNPHFSVYHVPIQENEHRLPARYVDKLKEIFKGDPTEWARLIDGEWIDAPTGDGLFVGYYVPSLHVRGELVKSTGLAPKRGFPIYIGYDIGSVWQAITFIQCIPTADGNRWIVFDENDHLKEKVTYKMLAWEVIEKMRQWRRQVDYPFQYCHITDESAINVWRPGGGDGGGYDAWEFEREFNKVLGEFGKIGADGVMEPAKMLGCPKGPGSVAARVRMLQSMLFQEELFVSALCENTTGCLANIEKDKDDALKPKRSKWLHKFDSISYVIFKVLMGGDPRLILPMVNRNDDSCRLLRIG